jgi:UDP-N-acetyl-D-mannosaminuronic acid dehydrogenase
LVPGFETDLDSVVSGADCLIIMVGHAAYAGLDLRRLGTLMRTRTLVDGRHVLGAEALAAAGFAHRTLGIGLDPHARVPLRQLAI